MLIYRPQRGGFAKAMSEAEEFESIAAMKEALAAQSTWRGDGQRAFEADDIVIDGESVDDERNGWHDTREVCVRRFAGKDYGACPMCLGYCATDYGKPKN